MVFEYNFPNSIDGTLQEIEVLYKNRIQKRNRYQIKSSKDAYKLLREIIFPVVDYKETFVLLCLNRANELLGYSIVAIGGISGVVTDVRVIFQTALITNSSSIIVAHNHPSGNLQPSEQDRTITSKISSAGRWLDIFLLDHIIITNESYYSFADEGALTGNYDEE
jgi:DNA repair protein RadC